MMFWSLAAAMMLVALVIVMRPLFRQKNALPVNSDQTNVALCRIRLAELDADVRNNTVTAAQAESIRKELERELLREIEKQATTVRSDSLPHRQIQRWKSAVFVALFIPLSGICLYLWLGQPEMINLVAHVTASPTATTPSIEEMIRRLELRLQQQPDDTEGWLMLSRSYMVLGRNEEAVTVLERLHQLASDDPDTLLQYAEALAMLNNGQLAGRPSELIIQALELDPENATGLLFAGMVAGEKEDFERAIGYWRQLLPYLENDKQSLERVTQLINLAQEQIDSSNTVATTLSEERTETTNQSGKSVTVNIKLDHELGAEISPGDTLFVYAQALDSTPMPVAVIRRQAKDLPLNVLLNDTLAISPQHKLSDYEAVSITARISESGNAVPQSGDLTGIVDNVRVGQQAPVQIVINKQIP